MTLPEGAISLNRSPAGIELDIRPRPFLYLSVGLVAGAVIALQICIMRIFSVGSWA